MAGSIGGGLSAAYAAQGNGQGIKPKEFPKDSPERVAAELMDHFDTDKDGAIQPGERTTSYEANAPLEGDQAWRRHYEHNQGSEPREVHVTSIALLAEAADASPYGNGDGTLTIREAARFAASFDGGDIRIKDSAKMRASVLDEKVTGSEKARFVEASYQAYSRPPH